MSKCFAMGKKVLIAQAPGSSLPGTLPEILQRALVVLRVDEGCGQCVFLRKGTKSYTGSQRYKTFCIRR
jgi:hypothetical protein